MAVCRLTCQSFTLLVYYRIDALIWRTGQCLSCPNPSRQQDHLIGVLEIARHLLGLREILGLDHALQREGRLHLWQWI